MDWTFIQGLANGDKLLQLWAKVCVLCVCVCVLYVCVVHVCCAYVCVVRMFVCRVYVVRMCVCVFVHEWMKCVFHLNIFTLAYCVYYYYFM